MKRNFDSEQSREPLFKLADPITPIFEVFIGNRIDSAETRSANTTGIAVIYADVTLPYDFRTRTRRHDRGFRSLSDFHRLGTM